MKNLNKIAVIGDKNFALPFKTIGADIFAFTNESKVKETLKLLVQEEDYAIIILEEKVAKEVEEVTSKLKMQTYPIILPIPDGFLNTGYATAKINKNMEMVIGKTNSSKDGKAK